MGNQCTAVDHCSKAEVIFDVTQNEIYTDNLELTDRPSEDFVQSVRMSYRP
jgi:hypothetical protein